MKLKDSPLARGLRGLPLLRERIGSLFFRGSRKPQGSFLLLLSKRQNWYLYLKEGVSYFMGDHQIFFIQTLP